ncbi:DUF3883 domain-containing protein [Bifidobacterium sp. ESL0690]|uniref:DUF3883 domain-containing protein n=1 Tax=Bifidobacterium sp. ESL0690 TaxID=2983214 RepID=UPI0023F665E8|nr:DUF3883 domain-containing protein [Bifidobacterium sp. ESL0690]WEV46371.1 DUF3883 domain-containing protein [Bifidobacterium sp. ESL0690]
MQMLTGCNLFLCLSDIFVLYQRIGDAITSYSDAAASMDCNTVALDNSLLLLKNIGLISYSTQEINKPEKGINSQVTFSAFLKDQLPKIYRPFYDFLYAQQKTYDEETGLFWISRNSIPFQYSGLVMISDSVGLISCPTGNRIFLLDYTFNLGTKVIPGLKAAPAITLTELKNTLAIKDEIGEKAEKLALAFEKKILLKKEIKKDPIQISPIDVTAGYDIASYLTPQSTSPDKFIEVKSCKNNSYAFFISHNELETAKRKRKSFFLYLYNRDEHSFTVFQDPYVTVFSNENWLREPQIYKVQTLLGEKPIDQLDTNKQ